MSIATELHSIDDQLKSLQHDIISLTKDVDTIALEQDPSLILPIEQTIDSDELLKLDAQYVKELKDLNDRWYFQNLIQEIENSLSVYEYESVFYSMKKFQEKLVPEWELNYKELRSKIIDSCVSLYRRFLSTEANNVSFYSQIEDLSFKDFDQVLHANIDDYSELYSKSLNLNKFVDEYVDLLDSKVFIVESETESMISLTINSKVGDSLQQDIASVVALLKLIQRLPQSDNILKYISNRFFSYVKSLIVQNVTIIDETTKSDILEIDTLIKAIDAHLFGRVTNWVSFEMNDFLDEHNLQEHIQKMKVVLGDKNNFAKQEQWKDDDDAWGDDDDAWGEELELDVDEITLVPSKIVPILKSFQKACPSRLNYLTTYFFAMGMWKYEHWTTFYNDVANICEQMQLPELNGLLSRFLENYINSHKSNISSAVSLLGANIAELKKIMISYDSDMVKLSQKAPVSLYSYMYQLMIDRIMSIGIISEEESQMIGHTVAQVLHEVSSPNIPEYHRLKMIGFMVQSHLSDIMDAFVDGDFYDLTTEEICKLIVKLFADSDLRRQCIGEIKSIREELQ